MLLFGTKFLLLSPCPPVEVHRIISEEISMIFNHSFQVLKCEMNDRKIQCSSRLICCRVCSVHIARFNDKFQYNKSRRKQKKYGKVSYFWAKTMLKSDEWKMTILNQKSTHKLKRAKGRDQINVPSIFDFMHIIVRSCAHYIVLCNFSIEIFQFFFFVCFKSCCCCRCSFMCIA